MKLNYIKTYLFITLFGLISVSCEKVIDVDLNSSNPIPVVDAQILKDSPATVTLSYTTDYFDNEEPQYIENAIVKLIDENDEEEILNYTANGIYEGSELSGTVHSSYTMEISFDNQQYVAVSELNPPSEIIEFTFAQEESNNPTSDEVVFKPTVKFKKTSNKTNYFMLRFWVNGKLDGTRYTTLEEENPSDIIEYEPFRKSFDANDIVTVRIYSIDEATKIYYDQLNDSQGEGMMGTSTPYNAKSNFGAGIMGYFVAQSYAEMTAIAE